MAGLSVTRDTLGGNDVQCRKVLGPQAALVIGSKGGVARVYRKALKLGAVTESIQHERAA